jgi:tetratricopeptide (TPR) repeat protein
MKLSTKILSLLAVLILIAASYFWRHGADYYHNGFAKDAKGDLDGALADYTKVIEIKPDDCEAYSSRGLVKFQKGDYDGAIADCSKAIEIKPDYAGAYVNRGLVEHQKGDLDDALADFNKAIEIAPSVAGGLHGAVNLSKDDFIAYVCANRGAVKYKKGDLDGAQADFKKAIELNPVWRKEIEAHGYLTNSTNGTNSN